MINPLIRIRGLVCKVGGLLSQGSPSAINLVESVGYAIDYFISDRFYEIAGPVGISELAGCRRVKVISNVLAFGEANLDSKFIRLGIQWA